MYHRQFFRIISGNPEYVERFCNNGTKMVFILLVENIIWTINQLKM